MNLDSRKTKTISANVVANADMRVAEIRQFCKLDEAGKGLIRAAMGQMDLSARGYHRVLTCACGTGAGKLALTIADLAGSEEIQSVHLAEALHASRSSEVDDGIIVYGCKFSPAQLAPR